MSTDKRPIGFVTLAELIAAIIAAKRAKRRHAAR